MATTVNKIPDGYTAITPYLTIQGAARAIELLAVLSRTSDFSVGCYCEDEAHCHRSVLRALLAGHGARIEET